MRTRPLSNTSLFSFNMVSLDEAEIAFRRDYPAFDATALLDELRATEYARLDEQGQVYLDYTGGGLYASSQLRDHMNLLNTHVFGNPHSSNPTSRAMTELDEQARAFVLSFFNASPDEYTVIFTPNASGALRLVGEAYPFAPNGHYLLSIDNHNSVNGIREFARAKGAPISYVPLETTELRMDEVALLSLLEQEKILATVLLNPLTDSRLGGHGIRRPDSIFDIAWREQLFGGTDLMFFLADFYGSACGSEVTLVSSFPDF
jgi:selenocysteine lyase/cysteine desulfurase